MAFFFVDKSRRRRDRTCCANGINGNQQKGMSNMGFWNDLSEFAEWAVENPSDFMDHVKCKSSELGGILSESAKEFGEIASDAYDDLTPAVRGPVQMFVKDHVTPVRGSIVCCDLAGAFEHSGVYVGNGKIIHRDGDGYLASVDPGTFLKRLSGFNPAVTIFVSCRGNSPVGGEEIACRAERALRDKTFSGYDLLSKNCHHFCQYCLTGMKDNGTLDFTFSHLEETARSVLDMNAWRVMDGCWRT